MHTAGEPLRIIVNGLPEIKGGTILEKRRYFMENLDFIRTGTMWEPRGHADMYGAVITEPVTADGNIGVFFMHNEGYSTMCGHAIIALTKLVLETGIIKKSGKEPELLIDGPAGRVVGKGFVKSGIIDKVAFLNVPSFVLMENKEIFVEDLGIIRFDIAYGGAFYALVEADRLKLSLHTEEASSLISAGRKIKSAIIKDFHIDHPFETDLGFLYGTIFTGKSNKPGIHSRNVCIFADGELDRSPTGSGISARAALHYHKGDLMPGESITIESIIGTTMDVKIQAVTKYGPYQAIIPEVSGVAYFTGSSIFTFDPDDPLNQGFLIH